MKKVDRKAENIEREMALFKEVTGDDFEEVAQNFLNQHSLTEREKLVSLNNLLYLKSGISIRLRIHSTIV
tara:strand:+ start:236 stop:445 length:210 start_codon:yes stop_codon:yes gene_type:complete